MKGDGFIQGTKKITVMLSKKDLSGRSIFLKLAVALNEQKQVMENNLIEANRRLGEVAARSIEADYIMQTFPFRTLNQKNPLKRRGQREVKWRIS